MRAGVCVCVCDRAVFPVRGNRCTDVFYFKSPAFLYDLVRFLLEFDHRRKVCRYVIRCPDFGVYHSVYLDAEFLTGSETGERVLPVR